MKIGIQTDLLDTNGYGRWNEQMYIKLAEHGFGCTDFAMANTNTIHDNKMNTDLHLMPYFGNIDWKDFAKALKDIDYKGNFTLETMPPRKLPTPIFEQMCILLVQTAQEVVSYLK